MTVVGKDQKMVLVGWKERRPTHTLLAAVLEDLVLVFRVVVLPQHLEMLL